MAYLLTVKKKDDKQEMKKHSDDIGLIQKFIYVYAYTHTHTHAYV